MKQLTMFNLPKIKKTKTRKPKFGNPDAVLTRHQWEKLDTQYQNTPHVSDSFSASGEHYVLNMILNEFGYYPNNRNELMKLAEELLAKGYKE